MGLQTNIYFERKKLRIMGKLEVKGMASKTINFDYYDQIKGELDFLVKGDTPAEACDGLKQEYEKFLKVLDWLGVDISNSFL